MSSAPFKTVAPAKPLGPERRTPFMLVALCVAGALYGGWFHSTALIAGMCLLLSYYVRRLSSVWRWLPVWLSAGLMALSAHLYGLLFTDSSIHAALLRAVGSVCIVVGLALYSLQHRIHQRERRALKQTLQAVNIGSERLTKARTPEELWQAGTDMLSELGIAPHFALLAYRPEQDSILLGADGEFLPFVGTAFSGDVTTEALALLSSSTRRYWHVLSISGQQASFGAVVIAQSRRAFDQNELSIMQAFARLLGAQLGQLQALSELRSANDLTLRSLGAALEQRDNETSGHTLRVVNLSLQMTRQLGWSEERTEAMRWGAYLHDLGKIAIPDAILHKEGQLSNEERAVMQSHTLQGCEMLRELPFLPAETLDVVRHHHERWDGKGYPDGLMRENIPEVARIFSIVDVYDALTSSRPYKAAWSMEEALEELRQQSGKHFDPQYVEVFARLVQENQRAYQPIHVPKEHVPKEHSA